MKPKYQQGDIYFADLNPAKGVETQKKRPCVIVSSDAYNLLLNTVIIAPISSSPKYRNDYYSQSPLFIEVPINDVIDGTILLQHLRCIDPKARIKSQMMFHLPDVTITQIRNAVGNFF